MEFFMKKISMVGLLLGSALAVVAALVFGQWLFWLGMGLALGIFIGTSSTRRSQSVTVRRGVQS
jgi:hypothetical protein